MTLALRAPQLIERLVSVDNAPIDAALFSEFTRYIQGMQKIEDSGVSRQVEADEILQGYEEASQNEVLVPSYLSSAYSRSLSRFDNFSLATSTDLLMRRRRSLESH